MSVVNKSRLKVILLILLWLFFLVSAVDMPFQLARCFSLSVGVMSAAILAA